MSIPNTRQIITRIVIIFSTIELLIMLVLLNTHYTLNTYAEAFLDSASLALLSTPMIYFWVVKPFIQAYQQSLTRITHIAGHDSLTGLPNRRLLFEYLEKIIASCKRHKHFGAVMLIDLDDFKRVNDSHGHEAGDIVLIEIAKRLQQVTRSEDMIARLGGDEFIFIAAQLDRDRSSSEILATQIAEKFLVHLQQGISYDGSLFHISASIGIRLIDADISEAGQAVKEADQAMYAAKHHGKTQIAFASSK